MPESHPFDEIPAGVFAARRAEACRRLGRSVLVLPAAPPLYRSRDTEVRYRPDSELYYLTGVTEPGAVAVLLGDEARFILFVRGRDPEAELWAGPRLGPEGAAERYGADETLPLSKLDERLPELLHVGSRIHYRPGRGDHLERLVFGALATARRRGVRQGTGPRGVEDPGEILDDMRVIKDAHEIERIREAVRLTELGHRAGLAAARPGVGEWEVEAAVEHAFRAAGGAGPGFETIVGSGPNACVLHYVDNGRRIEAGDLVLVDAGAEAGLYNGDVTRTIPASGRFTEPQREIYDLVEGARAAAVNATRPGATVADVHDAAVKVLSEGMVRLGLLEAGAGGAVEQGAHQRYFPHRTSHWLGLDVHDPGDYALRGRPRVLEPGMLITVEPGLYIPAGAAGAAARWAGIGVRIEDDVLVTRDGRENLTATLPTAASEVEAMVGGSR
jgi:Xaa-Pro aminopeptidase